MNKGMKDCIRLRSTAVIFWLARMTAKYVAAAQSDTRQAHADANEARQDRQREVPDHHQNRAVEQRSLGAQYPVGDPAPGYGRHVDQPAVSADQAGGGGLGQPESGVGRG